MFANEPYLCGGMTLNVFHLQQKGEQIEHNTEERFGNGRRGGERRQTGVHILMSAALANGEIEISRLITPSRLFLLLPG